MSEARGNLRTGSRRRMAAWRWTMMYEDDIKKLNKWFRKKENDSIGTYHHTKRKDGEDVYAVDASDVEEFCDFLRGNISDLIGFNCMVGNEGIWFSSDDLDKARFY